MMPTKPMTQAKIVTVAGCARCGQTHENIRFTAFTRPPVVGGVTLSHWGVCTQTGEPLFMQVLPDASQAATGAQEAVSGDSGASA